MTSPIDTVTWAILNNVEYKEALHDVYGTVYLPTFSKEIQRLNGKEVVIRGYLVPVDKTTWALSKNTYAACFFCGKAGPETVVGLTFAADPGKLKMDSNALIKGTFILNGTNVDDWMYSLTDARILSVR
jgi:PP-loop superfamily ATP-utilizing enzyme